MKIGHCEQKRSDGKQHKKIRKVAPISIRWMCLTGLFSSISFIVSDFELQIYE
jgi:hypothetical protein